MQKIKIVRHLSKLIIICICSIFIAANITATAMVYHGNIKSRIFHAPGCRYYNCKKCASEFTSKEEAINAGYRACKICKP